MRRYDHVLVAVEEWIVGDRLGREHVQRGAGNAAGVERVLERGIIDQAAARDVEDAHALTHLRELALGDGQRYAAHREQGDGGPQR